MVNKIFSKVINIFLKKQMFFYTYYQAVINIFCFFSERKIDIFNKVLFCFVYYKNLSF